MPEPTKLQIVRRAFELWQRAGCPDGKDKDLARQAEQELREEKSRPAHNHSPSLGRDWDHNHP